MRLIAIGLTYVWAGVLFAQQLQNDIESILDRLERRLQDEEVKVFDSQKPSSKKKKPSRTYKFKDKAITGNSFSGTDIEYLATAIGELESDIEELSAEVQQTKQKVFTDAKVNNFVEISAALRAPKDEVLKSLRVKIDGYEIYALRETTNLWLPSTIIPLYAGPMLPGKHQVEVEARVARRDEPNKTVNRKMHYLFKETYDIDVPDGTFNKHWKLTIAETRK